MYRLIALFNKYKTFLYLLLLEFIAVSLIVANNTFQGIAALNSSNYLVGSYLRKVSQVQNYLSLKETNDGLADENAFLRSQLEKLTYLSDSSISKNDSIKKEQFSYFKARVINNSVDRINNFITLNKGWGDGVKPSMGVISDKGVVGIVKTASKNFATVYSVLHSDVKVSVKHKKSNSFGSLIWEGFDSKRATFLFMPRHIPVEIGDSVVTSGFGEVFPEGVMVGTIEKIDIKGDESTYRILLKLSTDFSSVKYVYLVNNKFRQEIDSIQKLNQVK
ncbi:MAG: rod shape-determining protein MreC [Cytophagales bacterium]